MKQMNPNLDVCSHCGRFSKTEFPDSVTKVCDAKKLFSCKDNNSYIWHVWVGIDGKWLNSDARVPGDCPYSLEQMVATHET